MVEVRSGIRTRPWFIWLLHPGRQDEQILSFTSTSPHASAGHRQLSRKTEHRQRL